MTHKHYIEPPAPHGFRRLVTAAKVGESGFTQTIEAKPERDATYTAQLVAFFAGERHEFCQLVDALHIDATALAAEQASTTRTWCTVGTP